VNLTKITSCTPYKIEKPFAPRACLRVPRYANYKEEGQVSVEDKGALKCPDLHGCYRGSMWPSSVMLHKNTVTVQPASSMSVSIASHNYLLFLVLLKYCPYELRVIILDVSFFKVLFSYSRFFFNTCISFFIG